MPVQPISTYYLHVYDVTSGSWVPTTLGSGVSYRIREAMNAILKQDGILAYIGTMLEFGSYLSELVRDHGTGFQHCWISLPASTVSNHIGLCQNMLMPGSPELGFNGNHRTLMLAEILRLKSEDPEAFYDCILKCSQMAFWTDLYMLECSSLEQDGFASKIGVLGKDISDALTYVSTLTS